MSRGRGDPDPIVTEVTGRGLTRNQEAFSSEAVIQSGVGMRVGDQEVTPQVPFEKWDALAVAMRAFMESAVRAVAASPPMAPRWVIQRRDSHGLQESYEPAFDPSADGLRWIVGYDEPAYKGIVDVVVSDPRLTAALIPDAGRRTPDMSRLLVWIGFVGRFVQRYFSEAGTAQTLDVSLFDRIFDGVRRMTESPEIEASLVLAVPALELPDGDVQIDPNLLVRRVPDSEFEDWVNSEQRAAMNAAMPFRIAAIECRFSSERARPPEARSRNVVDAFARCARALQAVQLVADADVDGLFYQLRSSGLPQFGAPRGGPFVGPTGQAFARPAASLSASLGPDLIQIFNAIQAASSQPVELGLRRWSDALSRQRFDDRIIDSWIALEAMLCPDSTQEVQFRASLRLAALLGSGSERLLLYQQARDSYACRSKLVHGDDTSRWDLSTQAARVRSWHRRVLLQALTSGLPDRKSIADIEERLLS